MERYFKTENGEIYDLKEFKYNPEYHWYIPNEKWDGRNESWLHFLWCFEDEYDFIPECFGKTIITKIKKTKCKFSDNLYDLFDEIVVDAKHYDKPNILQKIISLPIDIDLKTHQIYGAVWKKGADRKLILETVAKAKKDGGWKLL